MWTESQRLFLNLSKKELAVLKILHKKGPINTTELAFESKIPRVTTIRIARKLWRRGFIARQTLRREIKWSEVDRETIQKRLMTQVETSTVTLGGKEIELSEVASVTTYYGADAMLESNKKLLVAHAGEKFCSIEPNGMWKHMAKVSPKEWQELNNIYKNKGVMVDMVLEEGFEKAIGIVDKELKSSFFSLASEVRVIPEGIVSSSTEVLIFRDQALFMDWEQYIAIEIKNPSTVKLIKGMFKALQAQGTVFGYKKGF
ncbi:MAG: hypothetical protein JWO50_434 [Candidatus Kaiserbacteria bacterium]|nr:hypothetical protein [Candidatus Kaiserbacteria bacterium]